MSIRQLVSIAVSGALALAACPALAQQAPAAAAAAPAQAKSPTPKPDQAKKTSRTDGYVIGAIVSYSLAAVAVGTYTYSFLRIRSLENDSVYQTYRSQPFPGGPQTDVCQAARNGIGDAASAQHVASLCSQSDTFQAIGIASVVTGVLGLATGTALLLMRPSNKQAAAKPAPRLAFTPVIGAHGAAAQFDYRF